MVQDGEVSTQQQIHFLANYTVERNTVNLGVAYQVRPSLMLTCDIANLFNEPQMLYSGNPDRTQDVIIRFAIVTLGVSSRF